jgi:ACDE family multidrug resistance protein
VAVTTQAVMTVSPVERPAAYSFARFIGGGPAPCAAGRLVLAINIHFPFYLAAGVVAVGIVVLATAHKLLGEAESGPRPCPATPTRSGERPGRPGTGAPGR